jgi:hypothetical protein
MSWFWRNARALQDDARDGIALTASKMLTGSPRRGSVPLLLCDE